MTQDGKQCERPASCHVGGSEQSCDLKCWQHAYVHIAGRTCHDEDRVNEQEETFRDSEAKYKDGYMDEYGEIMGSCGVWAMSNLFTNRIINPDAMETWLRHHSRF